MHVAQWKIVTCHLSVCEIFVINFAVSAQHGSNFVLGLGNMDLECPRLSRKVGDFLVTLTGEAF